MTKRKFDRDSTAKFGLLAMVAFEVTDHSVFGWAFVLLAGALVAIELARTVQEQRSRWAEN